MKTKKKLKAIIFLLILFVVSSNAQEVVNSKRVEDLKNLEEVIIKNTIKSSIGVEINRDNTYKEKYIIKGVVSLKTGVLKLIDESHEYEIVSYYTNFIDRELYNDFLQKNKYPIEIGTNDFEDYQVKFVSLEEINQIMNPNLDYKSQCEKLEQLYGKTAMFVASRPGISQDGNKAMIYTTIIYSYADHQFGDYYWSGYYTFFAKKNGKWEIVDYVRLG